MTRHPGTTPATNTPPAVRAPAPCPMCDGHGAVSEDTDTYDPLLAAAHVLVLRAMERAGRRLLTRQLRGQLRDVPAHLLHTRIPAAHTDLDRLMAGAWDAVPSLVDEWGGPCGSPAAGVVRVLDRYCRDLLVAGHPHEVRNLRWSLSVICR